jgi:FdhD protein
MGLEPSPVFLTSPLEGEDVAQRQERGSLTPGDSLPLSVTASGDISPSRGVSGPASPIAQSHRLAFRNHAFATGSRALAAETAIAISYNGSTHAVLMATPRDLEEFAVGFSLTEGIIDSVEVIESVDVLETPLGLDLQIRLKDDAADRLAKRRRSMAGPVGCGLCGIESLEAAMRETPRVAAGFSLSPRDVASAVNSLATSQPINAQTHAVHAAGFFVPGLGLVAAREDVGRHNALDKLIGAMASDSANAGSGAIVLTSRVSVEMVQKAAITGAPVIIAISAPTSLAVATAEAAGITLVAIARGDEFEVFTHAERITNGSAADAA